MGGGEVESGLNVQLLRSVVDIVGMAKKFIVSRTSVVRKEVALRVFYRFLNSRLNSHYEISDDIEKLTYFTTFLRLLCTY